MNVFDVSAEADGVKVVEAGSLDKVVFTNNVTKANGARACRDITLSQKFLKYKYYDVETVF